MGYLPGTLWIIAGVVLAGAVQDFMVLFISMRRDGRALFRRARHGRRSEEHTSALQSLMRISYAVFCLKKTPNSSYTYSLNYIHSAHQPNLTYSFLLNTYRYY